MAGGGGKRRSPLAWAAAIAPWVDGSGRGAIPMGDCNLVTHARRELVVTDQRFDVEKVYDELRRAVLEKLRQELEHQRPQDHNQVRVSEQVKSLLPDREIPERDILKMQGLFCQVYHELYLERIIVPGTAGNLSPQAMTWPYYRITDHGRQVLESREYSPYDPDGYLSRLKADIANLDETIVRYVDQSLRCLKMDCFLAAAVTLGCASEKAMLLLIEQFGQAISDPAKKKKYEKETAHWQIISKYKAFRKNLDSVAKDIPKELHYSLEPQLHGTFDLIRRIRNDAGHPTGEPITLDMIRASHIVFPGYCKYVYLLMEHFATNQVKL